MIRPEIVSQVNDVMRKGFELSPEQMIPTANLFTDLGLDSLDAVDMLVHLEDRLKIKVDSERLMTVRTLQDVYALVDDISLTQSQPQPQISQ